MANGFSAPETSSPSNNPSSSVSGLKGSVPWMSISSSSDNPSPSESSGDPANAF